MKRLFDIVISILCLIILAILFLIIIFMIRINLGSPVFFTQLRSGLNGRQFKIFKFRTMSNERDQDGELLSDSNRLKPFGSFLRSSSLDELPELWNVLKGEMSLVGPRPLLIEYLPLYSAQQSRRHEVKPGITGWAQVNGRNSLSWEEKFTLDVWYVDNQSLWLDLKILFFTAKKVLFRENISALGEVTMTKFTGTNNNNGSQS
jgi:sugar transferase EpsL